MITRKAAAKAKATTRAPHAAPHAAPDDGALALRLLDRVAPGPTWQAWRALLKGVFALPMSPTEAATFQQNTTRETLPTIPAREAWIVAGRRSGKSRIAALLVTFLAAIRHWRTAPGERPMVLLLAPSRRQAGVVLGYVEAMLAALPGTTVTRRTLDELELSTGVVIRIESASFRTPRGFSVVGVVADEIAFWRDETGAAPDIEILRAVRPPLASVPGSLLIAISSPYSTRGALYDTHTRHYGRADSEILVWQSDSRTLNPTLPQRLIDQALEDDPASASAEWLGVFRSDLESLFSREALAVLVAPQRFELRPQPGTGYVGFCDPSGGSADSFTMAVAHRDETGKAVLDCVREVRPPFSPEAVCGQFAAELKRYGCRAVYSDSYAAQWPVEQFAKHGVTVQPSPLNRSELYLELLPVANSGACELLDHPRMVNQFASLERRTGRTGKDAVDHPRGSHDDVANAAAGALVMTIRSIGLRAALPLNFETCINEVASTRCAFVRPSSPWFPSDHACRQCVGLRAVRGVFQQHQQQAAAANEPMMNAAEFLRARFDIESAPLTRRAAWNALVAEYEGHLGL